MKKLFLLIAVLAAVGCANKMPAVSQPMLIAGPAVAFEHENGLKFAVLPAGWAKSEEVDIELRRPILISKHEVTNAQFKQFKPDYIPADSSKGDGQPAANITPQEAMAFCDWLTKNDSRGRRYRLPRQDEWQYAARGGIDFKKFPNGDILTNDDACFGGETIKAVGSYQPNGFGLFDMAGNVAEWVVGDEGEFELRGGGWSDDVRALIITSRGRLPKPEEKLTNHGFRILCEPGLK